MRIEIRIYKRHDLDLMHIHDLNISLAALFKHSLTNYAHGREVRYFLPYIENYSPSDKKSFHLRFNITDPETLIFLNNIKPMQRNSFCKTLLRNSLVRQDMSAFLKDISMEQNFIDQIQLDSNVLILTPNTSYKKFFLENGMILTKKEAMEHDKQQEIQKAVNKALMKRERIDAPRETANPRKVPNRSLQETADVNTSKVLTEVQEKIFDKKPDIEKTAVNKPVDYKPRTETEPKEEPKAKPAQEPKTEKTRMEQKTETTVKPAPPVTDEYPDFQKPDENDDSFIDLLDSFSQIMDD